jgi:hypothetical protein
MGRLLPAEDFGLGSAMAATADCLFGLGGFRLGLGGDEHFAELFVAQAAGSHFSSGSLKVEQREVVLGWLLLHLGCLSFCCHGCAFLSLLCLERGFLIVYLSENLIYSFKGLLRLLSQVLKFEVYDYLFDRKEFFGGLSIDKQNILFGTHFGGFAVKQHRLLRCIVGRFWALLVSGQAELCNERGDF